MHIHYKSSFAYHYFKRQNEVAHVESVLSIMLTFNSYYTFISSIPHTNVMLGPVIIYHKLHTYLFQFCMKQPVILPKVVILLNFII